MNPPRASALRLRRRHQRHRRIRARVRGTVGRPRLSVFRSNRSFVLQLVNDEAGRTLLVVHDTHLKKKEVSRETDQSVGVSRAFALGKLLATRAREQGISRVVFDRGGYTYHGRVKAVADGARAGGLEF